VSQQAGSPAVALAAQARLAALKREEEWLHREQERLEAEKAHHVRQACHCLHVILLSQAGLCHMT